MRLKLLGLGRALVDEALCWVGAEGISVGSLAVTLAMARMRRPWSLLAAIMAGQYFDVLARSYPVLARNRHRWPGPGLVA